MRFGTPVNRSRILLTPAALLDTLHVGGHAPDEKNRLLVALVGVAQSGGETADCALTLMLLALWPGLDADLVIRVAIDGFSQAEVATELGLSEAATRKRYQRATRRLRDALQEFR